MGALYSLSAQGWTPAALANGGTGANSAYHGYRNAAVTDFTKLCEAFVGGEATASSVNRFLLRRVSTNVVTPTNVAPGPMTPGTPAASQQQYVLAGTGPVIASTMALWTAGFNAFGGIIREAMTPGQEPCSLGTTAPNADMNLASVSGTGLVSTGMVIESV